MTQILACIDGSSYSASVCDHAAWAAAQLDASVAIVHVIDRHESHVIAADLSGNLGFGDHESLLEEYTALDAQRGRLAQRRGRLMLDRATERVRAAGVREVVARQRQGALVDTIADLESDAGLIVIGKRGESAETATQHLGSNLERVVRAVHKPILVTPDEFQPIRRFLIAYDGGSSMRKAIVRLAHTPLLSGVECRILMVSDDEAAARRELDEAAGPLTRAGFNLELNVRSGDPDDVILDEVERTGIDLLVMGAYGHSRIRTLIIGSTTTATLRRCPVAVLMFRG
jgi:nucleotide-binding universal stress UspA family protein